mgnify:CR=1 FL=1
MFHVAVLVIQIMLFHWCGLIHSVEINWFGYNYLLVIVCQLASKQHDLSVIRTRKNTPLYSSPTNPAVHSWQKSRTFQSKTTVHQSKHFSGCLVTYIHRKYYTIRFLWCNKPLWIEVGLPCDHMYQHVSLYNAVYLPASCVTYEILILNLTVSENDSLYKILAPQWRFDKQIMVF